MDKKIISIYELRVWSDGTIETIAKPFEKEEDSTGTKDSPSSSKQNEGSSRIKQILQVIEIAVEGLQNEQIVDEQVSKRIVTKAVKSVADTFEVFETTVRDKINRQIDLSHSQFLELLIKFHNNKGSNNDLKNHLLKYLANHTFDEDQRLVEESFARFKKSYK